MESSTIYFRKTIISFSKQLGIVYRLIFFETRPIDLSKYVNLDFYLLLIENSFQVEVVIKFGCRVCTVPCDIL